MKKNLLTIGLIALSLSVQAQNVLLHVDANAKMFISEGTLVYNGGGLQTRGDGMIDNHGNIMVVGTPSDVLKTINTSGVDYPTASDNIILRLNNPSDIANSTYGQLFIDGIPQNNITGFVKKEFKAAKHGSGNYFQQIALPFHNKSINTLSTEFGKTFGTTRWSQNEVLYYDNTNVVSHHYTNLNNATNDATGYYMLGSNNNNLNTEVPPASMEAVAPTPRGAVYTISGRPYAPVNSVTLSGAGANVNFGANGNAVNQYNERYNSYLQDTFSRTDGQMWTGNFGKNMYQFGNPFLTNLDLTKIAYQESSVGHDGNTITNIRGIRLNPGTVRTAASGSTFSADAKLITFDANTGIPVGDVAVIIKPMETFVIKLRDNSTTPTPELNFNTLRRFSNTLRADSTPYSVTAARNGSQSGTIKQLAIIGLDSQGNELSRTYYAVSPNFTTGHHANGNTSVQAAATSSTLIGTYEEALNGGYDYNYTSSYWLYINEANENDFSGKNIKLVNYDYLNNRQITHFKFEIKENATEVANGTHILSAGKGFYYKLPNGALQTASHGAIVPVAGSEYDVYYGEPTNSTVLGTQDIKTPSRTMVIFNPEIQDYIVRFDPLWKKADIQVFDMSGKLVISEKQVSAERDFVIKLDGSLKNAYVVKIVSDKGDIVNTKILK